MAITFYQAILAFCLQDGPEALTQVNTTLITDRCSFDAGPVFPSYTIKLGGHALLSESDPECRMSVHFGTGWFEKFCITVVQYLYVDKYLEDFNMVFAAASMIRVLMSCRIMFIFSRFVYGYVDPAFHSLKVRCLLYSLICVKFVIFCAHGLRSIAVTFTTKNRDWSKQVICRSHSNVLVVVHHWWKASIPVKLVISNYHERLTLCPVYFDR